MTILSLELNELNVNYIKQYAEMGYLPNFSKIIDSKLIAKTISEPAYPYLEPWIQWPTVYTGLTQSGHGLFRLGDGDLYSKHKSLSSSKSYLLYRRCSFGSKL